MLHRLIPGFLAAALLAGCFGDGSSHSSDPTDSAADLPVISGSPPTAVVAGQHYAFQPRVTDSHGATALTFAIQNGPGWASFDTTTGQLAGAPTDSDVGTYANIVISVSDGRNQSSLPAFPIAVTETASGSANISWVAPTENTNGTSLTDLAGYVINYGTSANALIQAVTVDNPGILSYVLANLSSGTWYASVTAYTSDNQQSAPSPVISWSID